MPSISPVWNGKEGSTANSYKRLELYLVALSVVLLTLLYTSFSLEFSLHICRSGKDVAVVALFQDAPTIHLVIAPSQSNLRLGIIRCALFLCPMNTVSLVNASSLKKLLVHSEFPVD